ncbi:hypothetical protein TZ03_00640 [Pseudomonas sp. 10-1B]|nr:hypothetical protein TZ03_00640 [Pseudomonas sp. 10-1B]
MYEVKCRSHELTKPLSEWTNCSGCRAANLMLQGGIIAYNNSIRFGRNAGVFKFIEFKKLLEAEVGYGFAGSSRVNPLPQGPC